MRSTATTRNTEESFSVPSAIQGQHVSVHRQTGTWGSSGSARLLLRLWLSRVEMQGSGDADTRGAEQRVQGKACREGEVDERGGHGRSGKKVAGGGGRQRTRQCSGCLPSARGKDETAERPNTVILPATKCDNNWSDGRQTFLEFDQEMSASNCKPCSPPPLI